MQRRRHVEEPARPERQRERSEGVGTSRVVRLFSVGSGSISFFCPPPQSLSAPSRLVAKLSKLTHLDISRNGYSSMPQSCSWPSTLRFLNISRAKLTSITQCLPASLEVDGGRDAGRDAGRRLPPDVFTSDNLLSFVQVLDLSLNDLKHFSVVLPALRELHLSGNKFLQLPPGWLFPNLQTLTVQVRTGVPRLAECAVPPSVPR